jgi:hypothetical protein
MVRVGKICRTSPIITPTPNPYSWIVNKSWIKEEIRIKNCETSYS